MLNRLDRFIETEGLEKSYRIRQADLVACLDRQNADKVLSAPKSWSSICPTNLS